jgi:hypothetical protein
VTPAKGGDISFFVDKKDGLVYKKQGLISVFPSFLIPLLV